MQLWPVGEDDLPSLRVAMWSPQVMQYEHRFTLRPRIGAVEWYREQLNLGTALFLTALNGDTQELWGYLGCIFTKKCINKQSVVIGYYPNFGERICNRRSCPLIHIASTRFNLHKLTANHRVNHEQSRRAI